MPPKPILPNLQTSVLDEGDILLLDDTTELTNAELGHLVVRAGQFSSGDSAGESTLVHAVMWTKLSAGGIVWSDPPTSGIVFGNVHDQAMWNLQVAHRDARLSHEISEASGRFGVRNHWLRRGYYYAYQVRAEHLELARLAAKVARTWASRSAIKYSQSEASRSVVGSSTYGSAAAARAAQYARDAESPLPEWARTGSGMFVEGNFGNAFCSQFIIAAYQAASVRLGIPPSGITQLDAARSNVRDLHGALKRDVRFENVGNVRVVASEHDNT